MDYQFSLWQDSKLKPTFGGEDYESIGKVKRPFDSSKCLHIVLRASQPYFSGKENRETTEHLLKSYTHKYFIQLYHYSLNSNHQHLLLKAPSRKYFQTFLRVYTGQVSQRLLKSYKGKSQTTSFWEKIAWSRVVGWGRHFDSTLNYVEQNRLEFSGEISYKPRK